MSQRRYKSGIDRSQQTLFPPRLEDYISEHNPVRAIDAYIAGLDMEALGFTHNAPGRHQAGQPAYAPQMLLKLYLYGYLNRLRSSRTLERESQRNVELMWLLEGLQPSYKTIADFRKNNAQALRRTQTQFIVLCRALGLSGGQLVAVDGSFFKGNVSQKSFRTHRKLTAQMAKLEQELAQWHQALDAADREEAGEPASREERDLAEKLDALREALKEKTEALADLEQRGKTQYSPVDEEARLLSKRGQRVAGFNVQIVTDAQHKLIASSKPKEQAGHWTQRYRSRRRNCCDCVRRAECLTAKGQAREIWRDQYEADTEAVRQRVMAHPERLAQRNELVEHPFGTLKRRAGWDHFLVRGLEKVRGEWSLMAWAVGR
ncbi:transposase [Halopseudomonas bauzanensis]|uniref:IS1182 family transposase n=1 Tax=Halopseudomonas bauzanensis TaxID=653930 RepID=A0A4U0YFV9_9GAMM|nr:transposase [Halopseudomonas bauzanensis]TKA90782.1 hypothetical protein FA869_12005 [Halopseudomonas bauzanensis]